MSQKSIVLANGPLDDLAPLRERLAAWGEAEVIAADGGARLAARLGLQPEIVIGDLDSLDPQERQALVEAGVRLQASPADKDETDLELALRLAVAGGAEQVAVLGALGGRLDMTLANVLLLADDRLAGVEVQLWHGEQTAWIIRPPGGELPGQAGDSLSLIPLGGPAAGITTHNLAYPLLDETLSVGPARGVSNVIRAAPASVRLAAGRLLAVHTPGRA
jgi:thiamine pyrophosphokinase